MPACDAPPQTVVLLSCALVLFFLYTIAPSKIFTRQRASQFVSPPSYHSIHTEFAPILYFGTILPEPLVPEQRNENLPQELLTELPGILNSCLSSRHLGRMECRPTLGPKAWRMPGQHTPGGTGLRKCSPRFSQSRAWHITRPRRLFSGNGCFSHP